MLIGSCDLFTGPKTDLLRTISDEVDWANAERLTVTVAFPPEWGNSPQSGENKCGDTRKGYAFNTEFTPFSGYGFEKWLAFKTADYAGLDKNLSASEVEGSALNGEYVAITESVSDTGARTASVTINITEPVTLVPWCGNRPRLSQQTNPPLEPILTPFPFDQQVNIWFTMPVKASTLTWDNIRVTGIYTSGTGRGQPFHDSGDLSEYFNLVIPENTNNRLNLVPKPETAFELALLSISVTVGPGVMNENGIAMAQAEIISYQTDTREAQKAYRAESITASRNGSSWFGDMAEYPWNSPSIDRRFNKSGIDTAHIRFSVTPPEGAPPTPNRIMVVERRAYDLRGFNAVPVQSWDEDYSSFTLSGGVYSITHTLKAASSGIIQLLILPWYEDDEAPVLPLQTNQAAAEGQYVTVVLDVAPPDVGSLNARLNAPSSVESSTGIYVYGLGAGITLTVDGLEYLADNGTQGGIQAAQAWGMPWTMDEAANLYWYARIGIEGQDNAKESGRLKVYNNDSTLNKVWSPSGITDLLDAGGYGVYVKFEDGMGNITLDWKDTGFKVKYSTAAVTAVSGLRAVCNAAGNSITVSWTTPAGMSGAYVYVNGDESRVDGTGAKSLAVNNVPLINKTGVASGQAVGNVTRYNIRVEAYNAAGRADAQTLSVWNIPGMDVTQLNTVLLTQANFAASLASSNTNNFILTEDISLSNWTPLAGNFTGKFYGNGRTISVSGNFTDAAYTGVFGAVSGAEIRDLTVYYVGNVSAGAGAVRTGGLAGSISNGAKLRNVIVKGAPGAALKHAASGTANRYYGGVAGYMDGASTALDNVYGGLNLDLSLSTQTVSSPYFTSDGTLIDNKGFALAGGIAGYIINSGADCLTDCTYAADANLKVTGGGNLCAGGIAGYMKGGVAAGRLSLSGCYSRGNLDLRNAANLYVGGIIGYFTGSEDDGPKIRVENCAYEQGTIFARPLNSSGNLYLGGIVGYGFHGIFNECYSRALKVEAEIGNCNYNLGGFCGSVEGSTIINCGNISPILISETSQLLGGYGNMGGFAGAIVADVIIEQCWSEGTINARSSGSFYLGGFIGFLEASISKCYATGNVNVVSKNGGVTVGGLMGLFYGTLNQSFATGSVYVMLETPGDVKAGGLIGDLMGGELLNSYALGSVLVESPRVGPASDYGPIYAGGLVGSGNTVQNCFVKGNVEVRSASNGDRYQIYAGGIAGYRSGSSSNILNNVSLGSYIITRGNDSYASVNRILGGASGADTATNLNNNYANSAMTIGKGASYWGPVTEATVTGGAATNRNGANITVSGSTPANATAAFWTGLGFTPTIWNTSVISTSHPFPQLAWED